MVKIILTTSLRSEIGLFCAGLLRAFNFMLPCIMYLQEAEM